MEDDDVWIRVVCQDDPLELVSSRQLHLVRLPHLVLVTASSTSGFGRRRVRWTHGGDWNFLFALSDGGSGKCSG